ncbi:sigma-70 RNA polymerase sigma factor region 4 domain-containing protein [Parablautia muri]|uniref:Sigma-70 family RNA polymerase sigma factor n=1 Tax=Parablautia muri TaxID=2320879 RepID=A0A9X5BDV0_9FIRM|nr:sigma-70 family RNA polymerase sigma factor [Parablautia muri]NBJ92239.1 sigma-70 family RNA polymerase sigma factor [Parablautia muri]
MKANEVNYDRPLTEEERVFSANLENYDWLFKYMSINKLDQEEWYDILILHYLRAVKKYLNIPHLQQYEFSTILFRTLDNARINYFRDMNREKRMPSGGIVSLDWEEDSMNGKRTAPMTWIDLKQSVEKTVMYHEMISEILSNLNDVQAEIFKMTMEEYNREEIKRYLGIKKGTFCNRMREIKHVVIDYLSE